jgi:hypothetical protein
MKYLGLAAGGLLLACGGCVVHQPVPVAAPPSQAAAPAPVAQNCREFQNTVIVGGKPQQAYGTTCQQADGSWQISSPPEASPPPTASAAVPYPVYAPYPVYPAYPYYGYPGYYGPSVGVGVGFRFGGHGHWR